MKKAILLLCMAAGLLSCKEDFTPQNEATSGTPISFKINVLETKAEKTDWATGDKIFIFFNTGCIPPEHIIIQVKCNSCIDIFCIKADGGENKNCKQNVFLKPHD